MLAQVNGFCASSFESAPQGLVALLKTGYSNATGKAGQSKLYLRARASEKFLNGRPARGVSSSGRAIPYTNFRTTRLSSVVQSVGIAKSADCLLDNPTPRVACPSERARWLCRFKSFSLSIMQQAFSNFRTLSVNKGRLQNSC